MPANNVTAKPTDFRKQRGVYVLYDDAFKLVYVGQAGGGNNQRLFDRLKQHTTDPLASRWNRFSWFGIRWVKGDNELAAEADGSHTTSSAVLDHIEAILISAAEPPHNRQGGRLGEDVVQYLQYIDDDALGPTNEDMIREVWKYVRSLK
jgi:hypothetical protein